MTAREYAEVLAAHQRSNTVCTCMGWNATFDSESPAASVQHRAHVADALAAALPDPEQAVREALLAAGRRYAEGDDEASVEDVAGDYMSIVHGGDTGRGADWDEAYRIARETRYKSEARP